MLAARHSWARPVTDEAGNDLRTPVELLESLLSSDFTSDSQRNYRTTVKQFFDWMAAFQPQTPVLETQPGHIEEYRKFLADPAGLFKPNLPGSINVKVGRISGFFQYCVDQGRAASNPVVRRKGRRRAVVGQYKEMLTLGQIGAMLEVAERESHRTSVVIAVLLGMGLRNSELHMARVENLQVEGEEWMLTISRKGDREVNGEKVQEDMQTLDVPRALVPILVPYVTGRTEGPLIPGGTIGRPDYDRPLSTAAIYDTVVRVGAQVAPQMNFFPHYLRALSYTMASTDPNADPRRVADYFGHREQSSGRAYDHRVMLPGPGLFKNPVGLDWATQRGTRVRRAA
ncbi:hypothetical protein UK12_29175 [Saccharothrix sp. ST-888]|nr:hypothetical protein UK12_29175 [Saccharothrix sp. ST-888]